MKRFLALVLVFILLSASGCKASDNAAEPGLECDGKSDIYGFAAELLKHSFDGDSMVLSPISALQSLGMLSLGAAGNTLTEIEKTAGLDSAELSDYLDSIENSNELILANGLFTNSQRLTVKEEFLTDIKESFKATAKQIDFEKGKDIINQWVSSSTGGAVQSITDDISKEAVLLAVNAAVFNASWEKPFYTVADGEFQAENGVKAASPMLRSVEGIYLSYENAQGFIKKYDGEDYSFCAILPPEDITVSEYIQKLDGATLAKLLESAEELTVAVTMPSFETDSRLYLNNTLKTMGIKDAFNIKNADFSKISQDKVFINSALHSVSFSLTEQGTKAAAVTVTEGNSSAKPQKELVFTRPFIYMITDIKTASPLFIGVFTGSSLCSVPMQQKVIFTCGNTITEIHTQDNSYEFMGGGSVALSQLLADLEYSEDKLCKCLPEYTVDTEYKTGYGLSLGEHPYARCDEGQAELTADQASKISEIIKKAMSGEHFIS